MPERRGPSSPTSSRRGGRQRRASSADADEVLALQPRGADLSATPERADAARNRRLILTAAAELFAERGVLDVTMDDVAQRAGVGKGTLYRRFGDRQGLAMALLDDRERALQERILRGPAPLGPGADPEARLGAFVSAYLEFLLDALDLVLLSETSAPGARHRSGAHAFWATHCRLQLDAAGAPDASLRADVLLAALAADQVREWRDVDGMDATSIARALARLVERLVRG